MRDNNNNNQPRKNKNEGKGCYLSENNISEVDFKDIDLLRRFVSSNMKIVPRKRSGLSAGAQRKVARAIKQARIAGLLPFVGK
jgi:small subunit ribosomal protein S18